MSFDLSKLGEKTRDEIRKDSRELTNLVTKAKFRAKVEKYKNNIYHVSFADFETYQSLEVIPRKLFSPIKYEDVILVPLAPDREEGVTYNGERIPSITMKAIPNLDACETVELCHAEIEKKKIL